MTKNKRQRNRCLYRNHKHFSGYLLWRITLMALRSLKYPGVKRYRKALRHAERQYRKHKQKLDTKPNRV